MPARDREEACARLEGREEPAPPSGGLGPVPEHPELAFVFSDGAVPAAAGAELYREEGAFRAAVEECCALLGPERGDELRRLVTGSGSDGEALSAAPARAARFACQYALARLWMSWGVEPAAVLGHGAGEHAAACIAGALPLPAALAALQSPAGGPRPAEIRRTSEEGARRGAPRIACVSGPAGLRHLLEEPARVLLEVGCASGLARRAAGARVVEGLRPPHEAGGSSAAGPTRRAGRSSSCAPSGGSGSTASRSTGRRSTPGSAGCG